MFTGYFKVGLKKKRWKVAKYKQENGITDKTYWFLIDETADWTDKASVLAWMLACLGAGLAAQNKSL